MNMPPISVAKVTQTLLQPLVASEQRWETGDTPESIIINQLNNKFDGKTVDTAEEDTTQERWQGTTRYRLLKYNISLNDDKQVRFTRQVPWYTRFILLAAFFIGLEWSLAGSYVSISTGMLFWHYIIPVAVAGWGSPSPPSTVSTEVVMSETHPLVASVVLIGMMIFTIQIVTWVSLSANISAVVISGVGIIIAGAWFQSIGVGFPFRDTDNEITSEDTETDRIFRIPGTIGMQMATVSFTSISFIILAGTVGGAPPVDIAVTPASYVVAVPIAIGSAVLLFIFFISRSTQARRDLGHARLRPFRSSRYQLAAAILFLIPNLLFFVIGTIMLSVLAYGVTGNVYTPIYLLAPLIKSVFGSAGVSTVPVPEFLQATYLATDSAFQAAPIVPPRVYSLVYIAILSWPFLFILFGTIAELLLWPYKVLSTLARSRPVEPDSGQQLLPDDIEIRQIEKGVDLKPLGLPFGWRKYVIVSDVIIDRLQNGYLEPKQFEAIVRHEEYHLRERHYTIIWRCLGAFVGGRNALLAFKDYRASEDRADEYAIRKINQNDDYDDDGGKDALRQGIGDVIRTRDEMEDGDELLSGTPGIVRRAPIDNILTSDDDSDNEPDDDSDDDPLIVRANRWLSSRLRTTYGLYFGGSLVQTAHRKPQERLDRLDSDDDDN